ncbi:MAG TPA: hypothetical protein OIM45_02620 [Clostridiaceae bacterium]|nr:hypothetical protein [Clostridiaceae bacterium]
MKRFEIFLVIAIIRDLKDQGIISNEVMLDAITRIKKEEGI